MIITLPDKQSNIKTFYFDLPFKMFPLLGKDSFHGKYTIESNQQAIWILREST